MRVVILPSSVGQYWSVPQYKCSCLSGTFRASMFTEVAISPYLSDCNV
jgi:hypothetical protein